MLFEILCYAVAIVGTLAFFGNPTPATAIEAPQPQTSTEADHFRDVTKMTTAPAPAPAPAMSQAIAQPVATLVVKVDAPKTLTSAELRRQCQAAGIRWRNAHGQGRHMSKGEMIAALA